MLSLGQIERRTAQLLKENRIDRPSVDVNAIAEALGATIREEASEGDVSGALFREQNMILIGVNSSHSRYRKRFTVAHELGHLILHDDIVRLDHHYLAVTQKPRLKPVARRSQLSSEARDPREIEANRFAAALLMPAEFLERSLRNRRLPLSDEEIAQFASQYEVSVQAMTFRLINLGIPVDVAGK
jgi:Zn-dependent peptidase ImmA (M78 family)